MCHCSCLTQSWPPDALNFPSPPLTYAEVDDDRRYSEEAIMDVNPDKLNAFMGKMVTDLGAAMNASLMLVGDKLGLYKTLADKGPMSSSELAKATGTAERYVREWLAAQ